MSGRTAKPHLIPRTLIYGFFLLGLFSALAFRALLILQRVEPAWVRPAWYAGATGYLVFFLYRYRISRKRKAAIERFQLIEKLRENACLADEDREVLIYLLSSIRVSLEDRNYAVIFVLSVVAIAADLLLGAAG